MKPGLTSSGRGRRRSATTTTTGTLATTTQRRPTRSPIPPLSLNTEMFLLSRWIKAWKLCVFPLHWVDVDSQRWTASTSLRVKNSWSGPAPTFFPLTRCSLCSVYSGWVQKIKTLPKFCQYPRKLGNMSFCWFRPKMVKSLICKKIFLFCQIYFGELSFIWRNHFTKSVKVKYFDGTDFP